jgi:hypothetical protein
VYVQNPKPQLKTACMIDRRNPKKLREGNKAEELLVSVEQSSQYAGVEGGFIQAAIACSLYISPSSNRGNTGRCRQIFAMSFIKGISPLSCVLLSSFLLYLLRLFIYHYLLSPLAKIPAGHVTAHFSPLWILYVRWCRQEDEILFKLHQKYGPILRLGPNELSLTSAEALTKIRRFPMNQSYGGQYSFYG